MSSGHAGQPQLRKWTKRRSVNRRRVDSDSYEKRTTCRCRMSRRRTKTDMYPDESRSLENLRHMRLMALLRDMIDTEGGEKTAKALGVSYRTVSRTIESDRLTKRMSAVLERHLLLGGGSAAAQQRKNIKALEKRVGELEEETSEVGLEELRGVIDSGIEAVAGRAGRRRPCGSWGGGLAKLEDGRGTQDSAEGTWDMWRRRRR